MPDEIEFTEEDEAATNKAWDEIYREEKEAAAKKAAGGRGQATAHNRQGSCHSTQAVKRNRRQSHNSLPTAGARAQASLPSLIGVFADGKRSVDS